MCIGDCAKSDEYLYIESMRLVTVLQSNCGPSIWVVITKYYLLRSNRSIVFRNKYATYTYGAHYDVHACDQTN